MLLHVLLLLWLLLLVCYLLLLMMMMLMRCLLLLELLRSPLQRVLIRRLHLAKARKQVQRLCPFRNSRHRHRGMSRGMCGITSRHCGAGTDHQAVGIQPQHPSTCTKRPHIGG